MPKILNSYRLPGLVYAAVFAAALMICVPVLPAQNADSEMVYVVPVSGEVDPGMAAFIDRVYREVSAGRYKYVIFSIDTFGGRVDSAFDIVNTILKLPGEKTIAFVEKRAISAGAMIALASGSLAMAPGTTIGDTAPIIQSPEGPQMMGEKYQSPIRAKFRALAERNGYPVPMVEAMVTPEKIVYQVELKEGKTVYLDAQAFSELDESRKESIVSQKVVVEEGELLTMHAAEAEDFGFSSMTVPDVDTLLNRVGVKNFNLSVIEPNWSEVLVRFIGGIAPLLMIIGLGALYVEVKSPGFGFPGAIGILCLSIVFLNQYLVGLAAHTELLIILIGLVFMGIEVFVLPGFGLAGFAGIVAIAIGLVLALQDFVIPDPDYPWQVDLLIRNVIKVLGSYIAAFILGLFVIRYFLPRISTASEGPYLMSSLGSAKAYSDEALSIRKGDTGVALTYLRPSGKAEINDEMFDVLTENEYVEKGAAVVVTRIRGNWIIVEKKD